ncbi:MAG: Type 1 glutamine amidotransferase-like domain-containing protein [Patescibacteria group bacterium]
MKLLLTSAGFQIKDEILKILPKPPKQLKLAYILDATKPIKNTNYADDNKNKMLELGFQVEDIYLAGETSDEIRKQLKDKDIIYVQGGQPFYLLKQAQKSGFFNVVKELLPKGVIYIGVSAGTYLACPTIEPAFWKKKKRSTFGLENFSAMNLVPFLIFAHYKPQHKKLVQEALKYCKYPVKILTDDQALLITGDKVELVGIGPEIIL